MMKTIAITLSITALASGCKKDDKKAEPAGSGKVADPAPEAKKETGPFAGWDMAARKKAFDGAHVAPGGALGLWEAWEVTGDKVKVWDGKTEKDLELTVQSPCEVKVTERSGDGSSSSVTHHYTIKDGVIVMGLGNAGSRRGAEAIACVSNQVLTVDAKGACTAWELDMFGEKWESSPATCGFANNGDREVFKATVNGHESELLVEGDVLWSEQLARSHSDKVADFAAAKAARDAKP